MQGRAAASSANALSAALATYGDFVPDLGHG